MIKSGVKKTRDDVAAVMASIKRLTRMDVLVGVPSTKADRDDDAPLNNAQLAYIHTFGSTIHVPTREATVGRRNGKFASAKRATSQSTHTVPAHEIVIPPRPFLIPGVENAEPRTVPKLAAAARLALTGDFPGAEKKLNEAGIIAQNEVRAVINAGVPPPLAESTLRARRARGRTGDVPLVDTGELRNSITYVIRKATG
jgi:hypothetical protein